MKPMNLSRGFGWRLAKSVVVAVFLTGMFGMMGCRTVVEDPHHRHDDHRDWHDDHDDHY